MDKKGSNWDLGCKEENQKVGSIEQSKSMKGRLNAQESTGVTQTNITDPHKDHSSKYIK